MLEDESVSAGAAQRLPDRVESASAALGELNRRLAATPARSLPRAIETRRTLDAVLSPVSPAVLQTALRSVEGLTSELAVFGTAVAVLRRLAVTQARERPL